ncbi:Hypothetical predicted protein, partial [Pelobates cultripes]
KWRELGITRIMDICQQGAILPFPEIQKTHNLPASYIFPYLQLKSLLASKVAPPTS